MSGSRRWKFATSTSERLPPATEPASPAAAETTAAPKKSDEKKQYDCSNCGVDDEGNGTDAKMDTQARQQPVTDECADNTDNQVANKPEAAAPHDLARQPAGNDADHQYDDEAFIRKVHGFGRRLPGFRTRGAENWFRLGNSPCERP